MKTSRFIIFALLIAIFTGILLDKGMLWYCAGFARQGIVSLFEPTKISSGYILVAPYISEAYYAEPGTVELIDERGAIVHSWQTQYQTLRAILLPDGHLFTAMIPPSDVQNYPAGKTGLIQESDWQGNVVWEHTDPQMNHDFDVLPDGSVAYLRWNVLPQTFVGSIRGGMQTGDTRYVSEEIVVVNKANKEVWQWRLFEHVDPSRYVLGPLTPKSEWSHSNSLHYVESNPINEGPAFLLSARDINTIFLIDIDTGAILWQSPQGLLTFQHDAVVTDGGTVLVFDNGTFRDQKHPLLWSRVVEIDPRTDKVVWQYDGGSTGGEKATFSSSIEGGVQRLPNGNTLITLSTQREILEVTREGKIMWNYIYEPRTNEREHLIFKARKYNPQETVWGKRVLPGIFDRSLCGPAERPLEDTQLFWQDLEGFFVGYVLRRDVGEQYPRIAGDWMVDGFFNAAKSFGKI